MSISLPMRKMTHAKSWWRSNFLQVANPPKWELPIEKEMKCIPSEDDRQLPRKDKTRTPFKKSHFNYKAQQWLCNEKLQLKKHYMKVDVAPWDLLYLCKLLEKKKRASWSQKRKRLQGLLLSFPECGRPTIISCLVILVSLERTESFIFISSILSGLK